MNKRKPFDSRIGMRSIAVNIKLGYGDYTELPKGARGVIVRACVEDSGEIYGKMQSPIEFYVTLVKYFEKRIGLEKLFKEDDSRIVCVEFVRSSIQAQKTGRKQNGRKPRESDLKADAVLADVLDDVHDGDYDALDLFHGKAMDRYDVVDEKLSPEEAVMHGNINEIDNFDMMVEA